MKAVFSGQLDFMENNMDAFDKPGARVLKTDDEGDDIYGNHIREVTVEADEEVINAIGDHLEEADDESNECYGGWHEVE